MDIRWSVQSLLYIWPELPRLLGLRWAELFPRVQNHLDEIRGCRDDRERSWLGLELLDLLGPEERVHNRILAVRSWLAEGGARSHPDYGAPSGILPTWDDLAIAAVRRLEPPATRRYTDITAPRQLPRGKLGAVTVGLTREPESGGDATRPLDFRLDRPVDVHLAAPPPFVEVAGERSKTLVLSEGADPDPVVFRVRGAAIGRCSLLLDFRQDGLTVGSVSLGIEVCGADRGEEPAIVPSAEISFGGVGYGPPPDVDLRVALLDGQDSSRLHFVLHSPSGALDFHFREVAGKRFSQTPEAYQRGLLSYLDRLALNQDHRRHNQALGPAQLERRLAAVGERLWDELFPEELKTDCLELLESKVTSLQITSDEGWIPWELVRPDSGRPAPLCERFELTRWFPGRLGQSARLRIDSLACIAVADTPREQLPKGAPTDGSHRPRADPGADREYFRSWSREARIEDLSPVRPTLVAVEALLDRGGIDLWHIASHGGEDPDDADAAAILLAEGGCLRPTDLDRRRQRLVGERNPLVFLNVCSAGRQGRSLTGLGGWVSAWVRRSRCGALVAPLCTVADDLAGLFARTFYDALRGGETLGRAARRAREAVRDEAPHDPTWLSYGVYGHPNARLVGGRMPSDER